MCDYIFISLFNLLLFLLFVLSFACECIHAESTGNAKEIGLFVPDKTLILVQNSDKSTYNKSVGLFRSSAVVHVDRVVVAFAETQYKTGTKRNADIVARNITLHEDNWVEHVLQESNWRTQVAINKEKDPDVDYNMTNPGAVVKDGKVYLLAGSTKTTLSKLGTVENFIVDWDIELAVGEVKKEKNGVKEMITWGAATSLKNDFEKELQKHNLKMTAGSIGAPIVTSSGAFVFLLEAVNNESKVFSAIAYSKDSGVSWKISRVFGAEEGNYPAIVEWERGKLLLMILKNGYRMVYESSDMGETLTEAVGTLSRVWGNSQTHGRTGSVNGFIKAQIENKSVLLFAQPMETQNKKYELHLWVTDGSRIHDTGSISAEQENPSTSALLYADEKLFLLYDRPVDSTYGYFLAPLFDALQRVKSALGTWAARDAALLSQCEEDGKTCDGSVLVKGLVGFLSHGGDSSHWADEYLCVNATVSNAVKKEGLGFEFKGEGSGAQWLVDTKGRNRPYYFANYEFTFVATVIIHKVPEYISPVLSLSLGEERQHTRRLVLWFDEKKRWKKTFPDVEEPHKKTWVPGKAYMVALTLHEEKGCVYVDGEPLGDHVDMSSLKTSRNVSHFSIGRDKEKHGASAGHMTVGDVFLYNRALTSNELKMFVPRKEWRATESAAAEKTPQGSGIHTDGSGAGSSDNVGGGSDSGDASNASGSSEQSDTNTQGGGKSATVSDKTGSKSGNAAPINKSSDATMYGCVFFVLLCGLRAIAVILLFSKLYWF